MIQIYFKWLPFCVLRLDKVNTARIGHGEIILAATPFTCHRSVVFIFVD